MSSHVSGLFPDLFRIFFPGKDRERKLIDYRRTAEERKNYFESMERHMFARGSSVKDTGRESISTSGHHDSSSLADADPHTHHLGQRKVRGDSEASQTTGDGGEDDEAGGGGGEDHYEEAFARMKKAAGVSDVDEVVRRFETQGETAKHLQELQARAEKEIRDLGVVKERLEAEWELVKFMGQEENIELREKMEDLEYQIQTEQERQQESEEKLQSQNKLLVGIREGLDNLVEKLYLGEPPGSAGAPPHTRNSVELLNVCNDKMSKLMTRLGGINIFMKKMEMEEEGFEPTGGLQLLPAESTAASEADKEAAAAAGAAKKEDVESGPEEEEVPTRGFLKRQANMIVDAKSRSKRGNRRK